MKIKTVAGGAFFLNTVFFATYYAISKEALGRIDPIIFTFFEMMTLVPVALCIIIWAWEDITRAVVKRGILLGSCLCLALFTISIALKYTTATSTAFFPSLNGFLAAIIAWVVLRHPVQKATWFAGLLSVVGTVLLIANAEMGGIRGSLIAFLGGVFFTCYVFLSDHLQKDEDAHWPLFGVELLTMAAWASLIVLLFGNWDAFHPSLPKDIWVILYIAGACTFLPTLITVLMQKHISPVTVSFIYVLEPILGAVMANFYLHETLPLDGYIGGGLVVVGALIHTWGTAERPAAERMFQLRFSFAGQNSLTRTLGYPLLFSLAGICLVLWLGGFPPRSWSILYNQAPLLSSYIQRGYGLTVCLLIAQACSWLVAWISLFIMGWMATYRAVRLLFFTPKQTPPAEQKSQQWDVSYLRQMGVTSYPSSTIMKKEEKPSVQRRRRERRERFNRVDVAELVE